MNVTTGMIMYYGGMAGAVIGLALFLLLSKIFSRQRRNMKSKIIILG